MGIGETSQEQEGRERRILRSPDVGFAHPLFNSHPYISRTAVGAIRSSLGQGIWSRSVF